jgi:hypothetical protein
MFQVERKSIGVTCCKRKHKSIETFKMPYILQEMKERAPGILDVFVTIAMTKVKEDVS